MKNPNEGENVHCWDPQVRKNVCGAPSQIGSTKHVREVTCDTCLELLGSASRPPGSMSTAD